MGSMAFASRGSYNSCVELLVDPSEFGPSDLWILWFGLGNFYLLWVDDDSLVPDRSKIFPGKVQSGKILGVLRVFGSSLYNQHLFQTRFLHTPDTVSFTPSYPVSGDSLSG